MYFTSIAINIYMGIKITELTSASTLVGNELTPLIQSTETRQTAVSSVFTALTSQNDGRYVCGISCSSQGSLAFTGAGNGTIDLGLRNCSNVQFAEVTACGDMKVCGGSLTVTGAGTDYICTTVPLSAYGGVDVCSNLNVRGNTILGDSSGDTLTIGGCSVTMSNLPEGVDNSVIILDSDNTLRTDEIDSKVWGGKLLSYCAVSVGNNKVPKFIGTDGTVEDSIITQTTLGTISVGGDLVVTGCYAGSTSTFCSDVSMCRGLTVSGNLTVGGSLTLSCLPTSDPLVSGGIWHSGGFLRISCCT